MTAEYTTSHFMLLTDNWAHSDLTAVLLIQQITVMLLK